MSFTSRGTNEILVAGLQDKMFVIDVNKGEIVKQVNLVPVIFDTRNRNTHRTTVAYRASLYHNEDDPQPYLRRNNHRRR